MTSQGPCSPKDRSPRRSTQGPTQARGGARGRRRPRGEGRVCDTRPSPRAALHVAALRGRSGWEKGVGVVRVGVEIVGRDTAREDYPLGPAKYAASGTRELWVFDPEGYGRTETDEGPWTLRVWRRSKGGFRRVYAGDGPFRSVEPGAWRVVGGDLLRVSEDREGTRLWPTTAEERDQERAAQAQAHAAQQRARAEQKRDTARAKAEAAETRIRALEALLAARGREG